MKRVIILGAGLAGMTIALELRKRSDYQDAIITILEKQAFAGGLLHSDNIRGHNFDNGCYVYDNTSTLISLYPTLFQRTSINWKLWLDGKLLTYPPNYHNFVSGKPLRIKFIVLSSMLWGRIVSAFKKPENAYQWLNQNLGKTLVKMTYLDGYLDKLQGISAKDIDVSLCDSRLDNLKISIGKMIRSQLMSKYRKLVKKTNSYVSYYPINGTATITDHIYKQCTDLGINFVFGFDTKCIHLEDKCYQLGSTDITHEADELFSTIPLTEIIQMFPQDQALRDFPVPKHTTLYVIMFLTKNITLPGDHAIIYSFEQKYIWKRAIATRQPDGTMSVIVEVNLISILNQEEKVSLIEIIKNQLILELKIFNLNDVLESTIKVVPFSYPVYRKSNYSHVPKLREYIQSTYNIKLFGRQGKHDYISSNRVVDQIMREFKEINLKGIEL